MKGLILLLSIITTSICSAESCTYIFYNKAHAGFHVTDYYGYGQPIRRYENGNEYFTSSNGPSSFSLSVAGKKKILSSLLGSYHTLGHVKVSISKQGGGWSYNGTPCTYHITLQ